MNKGFFLKNTSLRALASGFTLSLIAALCVFLVLSAQHSTATQIADNQDEKMKAVIKNLLPDDILNQETKLSCRLFSHDLIGKNMPLFIVEDLNGNSLGYISSFSTSRGYSNPLILIAGLTAKFDLYKVDIQNSKETPGIGDKVDRKHGDFLEQLNHQNLHSIKWDVKKFGGDFDYITGATVTSRAIVLASRDLLEAINTTDVKSLPLCEGDKN